MDLDTVPTAVRRLIDATNAGDMDAFVAGFTADGVVDDWGREFAGPEAIRGWSDRESIGKHQTFEVDECRVDGDTVTLVVQVGGDGFTGPSTFTFTVDGDRVSRMVITE